MMGRAALRAAIEDGRLTSFSRKVVVDQRRAADFATRAAACLLHAGPEAVLARDTALALHGCSAASTAPIHVLVPYHRKLVRRPGLVVHHGTCEDQDVCELDGLKVQALELALSELLCRGSRRAALACADQALALQPERARAEFKGDVEARIRERPDPRGRRRSLVLLDLATGLPESPPESWLLLSLSESRLPVPVAQHVVADISGVELYRLDFAWPELRIAVEYDGYEAHAGRERHDAARDEDLRRRGWIVIRATIEDLRDPGRLFAAIEAAFRVRGLAA